MAFLTDGYKLICRELFSSLIVRFEPIEVYNALVPDESAWDDYGGFEGEFLSYLYSNNSAMSVRLHDEWVCMIPDFCEERGVTWEEFYHDHLERLWWGLVPVPKLFQTLFLNHPTLFPTIFKGTSRRAVLKIFAKATNFFSQVDCFAYVETSTIGEKERHLFMYREEGSPIVSIIPYSLWLEPILRYSGHSAGMPLPHQSTILCDTRSPVACLDGLELKQVEDVSVLYKDGVCIAREERAQDFFLKLGLTAPERILNHKGFVFEKQYRPTKSLSRSFEPNILYGTIFNVIQVVDLPETRKIVKNSHLSRSIEQSISGIYDGEYSFLNSVNRRLVALKSALVPSLIVRLVSREKVIIGGKATEGKEANILHYIFTRFHSGEHIITNAEMRHDISGFGESRDNFTRFFNGVKAKLEQNEIPVKRVKNGVYSIVLPNELQVLLD